MGGLAVTDGGWCVFGFWAHVYDLVWPRLDALHCLLLALWPVTLFVVGENRWYFRQH